MKLTRTSWKAEERCVSGLWNVVRTPLEGCPWPKNDCRRKVAVASGPTEASCIAQFKTHDEYNTYLPKICGTMPASWEGYFPWVFGT